MAIPGYDVPEKAEKLIADSKALIEKYKAEGIAVPAAPVKATVLQPVGSAKSQADERLRAGLAALQQQSQQEGQPESGTATDAE
jgi:N utilization substance protein A